MGFSPRNGEVILKRRVIYLLSSECSFSPRNGEVILKLPVASMYESTYVSVPAMGK